MVILNYPVSCAKQFKRHSLMRTTHIHSRRYEGATFYSVLHFLKPSLNSVRRLTEDDLKECGDDIRSSVQPSLF